MLPAIEPNLIDSVAGQLAAAHRPLELSEQSKTAEFFFTDAPKQTLFAPVGDATDSSSN